MDIVIILNSRLCLFSSYFKSNLTTKYTNSVILRIKKSLIVRVHETMYQFILLSTKAS